MRVGEIQYHLLISSVLFQTFIMYRSLREGNFMKALNQLINEYTCLLQQGEVQIAYKSILEFIGRLRAECIRKHPDFDIGGVYQGYMDMSYFSLSTKLLKEKGLKIAIVYLHEKGAFEVWLSARNREIAKKFEFLLTERGAGMFHDSANPDAIVECTLTSAPDFEDQAALMNGIVEGVEQFVSAIAARLANAG